MPKNDSSNSIQLLDQISTVVSDFVISQPINVLRLQCQANSAARISHISPISASILLSNQIRQHGPLKLVTKSLQSNCAFITIDGIFKKIIIEVVSELTGIDLNFESSRGHSDFTSVSDVKNSISSYVLRFLCEGLKIVTMTTFYSSNLLIKVNSLIATGSNHENRIDYGILLDFFRVAWNRLFLNVEAEGFQYSAFAGYQLILPTLLAVGSQQVLYATLRPFVSFIFKLIVNGDQKSTSSSAGGKDNKEEQDRDRDSDREFSEGGRYDRRKFYQERYIDLITTLIVQILTYKLETVSTKMHVQGTRSLVDNTDLGYNVIPISTRFRSLGNAWKNLYFTNQSYNGFGFVILDFVVKLGVNLLVSGINY